MSWSETSSVTPERAETILEILGEWQEEAEEESARQAREKCMQSQGFERVV